MLSLIRVMYLRGQQIDPDESNMRQSSFNLRYSVALSVVTLSLTFGAFMYIKYVHPFFVESTHNYP